MNTLLRKSATTIVALALILGAWVATAQSSAEAAVRQTLGWGYAAGAAAAEFDGTRHHGLYNSTHTDVTGSAALSEGTIQVSFTPKRATGVQTLAHFFNSAAPDAGAVLATDGRSLVWKVGANQVTVPVELTLNQPHQVHVTVTEGRLRIFLDASPVHFGDSIGFLSSVTGMNSFDIGGRNTSGQNGYADFYTGSLQRLSVLTGPLTTTQMRTVDQALNRFPVGLGDFTTLGAELAPARTGNRTWVFTGDSITHGNVHTYGVRTWSEQFAQRLVELGHASDTVVNTGISGDTSVGTSSTLGVNTRFADRVDAYEPDIVVVMLGMNDAASQMGISQETYVANMAEIVDKIRAAGATPILAVSNPIRSAGEIGTRGQYTSYVQGLRAMAASKQVVLVDHFADWMTQPGAAMPTAWFGDAIHPNGLGHWHFARTLLQTLGAWDPTTGIGAESDTPANGLISNSSLELSQGPGLTQSYGYAFTGTFDGTRMEERSADLAGFPLHRQVEGTYAVRFTTTSAADGVLLNMSDSSAPGSALTLRSVGGGVRALVTRNGATLLDLASGDLGLDDGREHTVALAAGNTTTRLTVDGVAVGFVPRQVFGADVVGADTLTVGATKTQTGPADGFVGSIGRVFALHEPTEPVQQITLAGNNTITRSAEVTRMLATLSQSGAWQSMESRPIAILGEGLSAPEDGWRRWSDTLQERHRGERNHRQDYVTSLSPGADDLPARVAWLLAQERLAGSRIVIVTAVEGDLQAAGGSAAYQAQAEAAVAALRTTTRIPLLMTSSTAESGTNDALRSAATASGAVLIDAEAEALQVGSGVVPPSWRSGAGLSGLGHERTAFRVLKDLFVWGSGNVANSHPVAPSRGTLTVGPAMQAAPGETVEIPVSLAVEGTAHDVAFQAQTAGDVAPVVVQAGASSTGASGSVLLEGVHAGTVTGTAELTVPTTARAGEVIRLVVNASLGNQRGRVPARTVEIRVAVADTTPPAVEVEPWVSVEAGSPLTLQVEASDASIPLSYAADGLPSGLSINATTGEITGQVDVVGTHNVTVTVTDAAGNAGKVSFTLEVKPSPSPSPSPSQTPTPSPSPTKSPTLTPSPTPSRTPSASATPSVPAPSPTLGPTAKPSLSARPNPTPTTRPTPSASWKPSAPYTLPGLHNVNARMWNTTCEAYSQTTRCRTEIWASVVVREQGRFVVRQGWAFNNLTYLPHMTRAQWKGNPLGENGTWIADDGRRWRTECDTAATGHGACRSYAWATIDVATGSGFAQRSDWMFNNIVMFASR